MTIPKLHVTNVKNSIDAKRNVSGYQCQCSCGWMLYCHSQKDADMEREIHFQSHSKQRVG
jgi:hypothetical protein